MGRGERERTPAGGRLSGLVRSLTIWDGRARGDWYRVQAIADLAWRGDVKVAERRLERPGATRDDERKKALIFVA